jgi:ABC-type multidrug transport system fused ATPase/permease subunit
VPCILCILLFLIFNVKAYTTQENFPCLVLLMLLYGWSCIPLMYPLNYIFKVPSTAFVVSSSMNVFIGTITTLATTVLTQLGSTEPDLLKINDIIKPIFIILFPHYCLGQGFIQMSLLYYTNKINQEFGIENSYDPFKFENNGRNLLAMFFQGIVYFILNLLIQYKFFIRIKPTQDINDLSLPRTAAADQDQDIDDDVLNEKQRIAEVLNESVKIKKKLFFNNQKVIQTKFENELTKIQSNNDKDYIKIVNLTKIFQKFNLKRFKTSKHVAVNNLSLGINKGECFGLIGVNGAGKTTTFKMITGEMTASAGDVLVDGLSVSKEIEKVHKNIGYW